MSAQGTSDSRQVSDTSSINDSNSEALIASSDDEQDLNQLQVMGKRLDAMEAKACKKSTDSTKVKNKQVKAKSKVTPPVALPSSQQHVTQMPDLQTIQQGAVLQAQVAKRLKELTDSEKSGTKLKSLGGGPVEVMVPNRVK